MNLCNARVLLTGAAGGIGAAIAKRLARSGAELLLTDLRLEPLQRVARDLECTTSIVAVAADVTTDEGRRTLVARAHERSINVLINAAGVNPFGLLETQSSADVAKTILINSIAPIALCQALLPALHANAPSHIVNIGSTFGSIGYPGFCVYSASKFAVRGFTEALRREVADSGLRVHYVAPRATRTALATDRIRAMNEDLGVGMDSVDTVALAIERVLRDGRPELLLGLAERWFAKLNALVPRMVDRAVRKQLPIVQRYAREYEGTAPSVPPSLPLKARGA